MSEPDQYAAHGHSANHREELMASERCGCFHCLATFAPSTIVEWVDEATTALCPRCGIDSVLGDRSGYDLTPEFLGRMHQRWFERGP